MNIDLKIKGGGCGGGCGGGWWRSIIKNKNLINIIILIKFT
jgi:hypothetical protein